jgi:hypothetical protein
MRSPTACLGIALGALWITHASLADDPPLSPDTLAPMPANPVTSPPLADKDAGTAPTDSRQHGRDKHEQHADPASVTSAPASTPSARAASAELPAPPATPKQVCRNVDVLGSKIPKRVCATPDEWATFEGRAREDTRDGLRRLRDQGAIAPPSPGVSASQLPPSR